jgi:excisionase family DNA binding protein
MLSYKRRWKRSRRSPSAAALAHTVDEFCARANVSRPTAYRMMNDGQLRYAQLRGRRMIPTAEYVRLGLVKE